MTKQELANKKSSEVRNNATLFSLFKTYMVEDWGKIPNGCFGSSAEWAEFILSNKSEERKLLFTKLPAEISTPEEKEVEEIVVAEIEEKKNENLTPVAAAKIVKRGRKK